MTNAIRQLLRCLVNGLGFFALATLLALGVSQANAFSLLGPYTDWMNETNGYGYSGDIGGPMDLGEEYRWPLPIATYGFDPSFVDYFGEKGVKAVEGAIKTLNRLPRASRMNLADYPLDTQRINYQAAANQLYDLESVTLGLLLEQLGLGAPTRNVFQFRNADPAVLTGLSGEDTWTTGIIPNYIIERNFDPVTCQPSHSVNGTLYTGAVHLSNGYGGGPNIGVSAVDPLARTFTAVADRVMSPGMFYTGLTRDDAGGLRYLLSKTNVNLEDFLKGMESFAPREIWYRPGMEKVFFVKHPYQKRSHRWYTMYYRYPNTGYFNGHLKRRMDWVRLEQPDFLFCAADTTGTNGFAPLCMRTGTSNWFNSRAYEGGDGPGIICPPTKITFDKRGPTVWTTESPSANASYMGWGHFKSATNTIGILNGVLPGTRELTIRLSCWNTNDFTSTNQVWRLPVRVPGLSALQYSADQTNWTTLCTVTNSGGVVTWTHWTSGPRTFRVVPASVAQPPVSSPWPPVLVSPGEVVHLIVPEVNGLSVTSRLPVLPPKRLRPMSSAEQ